MSDGADRAIRFSTAVAVVGVAGIAAYVSYQHAYEVVRAHGESRLTARLEPATIDGLVYASSMVILYAARHRLPVPGLARWLLALGIVATLAANVAHGWPDGPVGAVVAAWPAASLVGSYELLLWLIRTAAACAPDRGSVADQAGGVAHHSGAELHLLQIPGAAVPSSGHLASVTQQDQQASHVASLNQVSGPGIHDDRLAHLDADQAPPPGSLSEEADGTEGINAAAVVAYRASLDIGKPLSERRLAAMFGKTSRRWARNRMAEASVLRS